MDIVARVFRNGRDTVRSLCESMEVTPVVSQYGGLYEFRMMLEIQIVDDIHHLDVGVEMQWYPPVRGKEKVRFDFPELVGETHLEKEIPEVGMACGRIGHDGGDVGVIDEGLVKRAVEDEIELVLGVLAYDTAETLMREPADAFQPVF